MPQSLAEERGMRENEEEKEMRTHTSQVRQETSACATHKESERGTRFTVNTQAGKECQASVNFCGRQRRESASSSGIVGRRSNAKRQRENCDCDVYKVGRSEGSKEGGQQVVCQFCV